MEISDINTGTGSTPLPDSQISYLSIIRDLQRFRGSAMSDGDYYDFPNHTFFRILFHFHNNSDATSGGPGPGGVASVGPLQDRGTGLLDPTWLQFVSQGSTDPMDSIGKAQQKQNIPALWDTNTAWSYLVLNNEIQRAINLQSFIELLSNINSNTPWYFQSISGLDTAVNRPAIHSTEFAMKPERDKISINCLPDSYDFRINTLMDLYRSVVWSWETKREMVPANLRKFDMTIIAFQLPIKGLNMPRKTVSPTDASMRNATRIVETADGFAVIYDGDGVSSSQPLTSYKAWEFHGCEFDYNSATANYADISNAEGTPMTPRIEILYDDCFEIRFNEFLGRHISDLMGDAEPYSTNTECDTSAIFPARLDTGEVSELKPVDKSRIANYEDANPFYMNPAGEGEVPWDIKKVETGRTTGPSYLEQAAGAVIGWGTTQVKKIYLGNLFGISLSKIRQQLGELDDLWATVGAVRDYVTPDFNGRQPYTPKNLYPSPTQRVEEYKKLGNLYNSKTIINS